MIRSYTKKQLERCSLANLNFYEEATHIYRIPKYKLPVYKINTCYLILVADYLIGNTTTVLATNWNKGTAPQDKCLKIYVSQIKGKMIYVESLSYDLVKNQDINRNWSGWLSVDDLTQLTQIYGGIDERVISIKL